MEDTYRVEYHQRRGKYKNKSREERARDLNNIICPRCKYQNHKKWVEIYGRCNLCGATLSKKYFKKELMRYINGRKK